MRAKKNVSPVRNLNLRTYTCKPRHLRGFRGEAKILRKHSHVRYSRSFFDTEIVKNAAAWMDDGIDLGVERCFHFLVESIVDRTVERVQPRPESPESPQLLKSPESPKSPEKPETPKSLESPETPETPETPGTPGTPKALESPKAPASPKSPESPKSPDSLESPETPKSPEPPESPESPSRARRLWRP